MAGKKSLEKRLYWQDIVNRQADSGLSVRQFCAKERVSEPSFYIWRRRLRGRESGQSAMASRHVGSQDNGRDFIPLELVDNSGGLEVIHPLGYRVRLSGEVDAAKLQCVLDILDGRNNG